MKNLLGVMILAVASAAGLGGAAQSATTHGTSAHRKSETTRESATPEIPIACNLNAFTAEQRARHHALLISLGEKVLGVRELRDGYAYRFAGDARTLAELAEWAPLERACCPFLRFTIELEPGDGPAWLRLTGKGQVKEFVRAEFQRLNR